MSTQAKFFFTGNSDQFTKALSQVKKSMKQVATQTVALQAGLKLLSATVNTVARTLSKVLSTAVTGIVNLVKGALNTIKSLITGTFKFIKSALTTLLSWMKKALGTVFDWIGNTVKKLLSTMGTIASSAIKLAKKTLKEIIDDVQAYADKEYNQIQLKVSLGDSYGAVFKDFQKLVKYTTADRNDLLSVYSTFAELGKSPEDVVKYARATVYLSNATGRSLSQITRLLLGQEAAGRDLEKVLGRIGITLTGNEESISNVEKIIAQLDDEMNALANGSLSQVFANIKNDIQAIKENIGYIFSGPVRYIAQKVEGILDKIANSNKIESLADKLNAWFRGIEPFIDKIFDMIERIMRDPEGFLKALWADIQTIFSNIKKNFTNYLNILGYIIGKGVEKLGEALGNIEWDDITKAFNYVGDQVKSFVLAFGKGISWWTQEDIDKAGGSFKQMFINAWNDAHPEFELKKEDSWFKNLGTLLNAAWELALKPLFTDVIKPDILDPIFGWFEDNWSRITATLKLIGQTLATAIYNAIIDSPLIDLINLIPGVNLGRASKVSEYQEKVFAGLANLAYGENGDTYASKLGLTSPEQLTKEWLNAPSILGPKYGKTNGEALTNIFAIQRTDGANMALTAAGAVIGAVATGGAGLVVTGLAAGAGGVLGNGLAQGLTNGYTNPINYKETLDALNALKQYDHILVSKDYPDILNTLRDIWTNTDDMAKSLTSDTYKHGPQSPTAYKDLYEGQIEDALRTVVKETTFRVTPVYGGSGHGAGGGGGIQDFYGFNEFKIKPYAKGGLVTEPTLALIGEDGPEAVVPVGNATGNSGQSLFGEALEALGLIEDDLTVIDKNSSELYKFFTSPSGLEEIISEGTQEDGNTVSKFQKWVDTSKVGKILIKMGTFLVKFSEKFTTIFTNISDFFKDFKNMKWYEIFDRVTDVFEFIPKLGLSLLGTGAKVGAFGTHIGNIYSNSFDEDGKFSILQMFSAIIQELLPYLQKGLDIIAPLFDQAFEILGNAVQILGERIGKQLLPILEAFVPFMKTFADIVIALAPVAESILKPAIMIIAAILQVLTGVLDKLMPVFAALGAVIQWISDSISYAVASVINWIASFVPWVSSVEAKKPNSIKGYYNNIMGTYEASKANTVSTPTTSSAGVASQTASYNGSTTVYQTNDFSGAYVIGNNGFRELALIIRRTLEDADYASQSI